MAAAAEGSDEQRGRGGRWRRAWAKLRDAVKRSSINSTAPSKSTSPEPMDEPQPPSAAVDTTPAEPLNSPERVADWQPPRISPLVMDTSLIADDSINADDPDEPLLPMLSTRTGLSTERAQRLFEKYGIKYELRHAGKEADGIHDVRRVEKPIRIRVHYSCDECGTSFGVSRTCAQCGHRRCRDCHRNPSRRVRDVLHEARQQQQERARQALAEQHQSADAPMAIRTVNATDNTAESTSTHPNPWEQEAAVSDETADTIHYQYVVQHRPRAGVQVLLRPSAQLVRRKCHECETHFEPATRTECQTCSHIRCTLCPYEMPETATPEPTAGEPQQPALAPIVVATVQRVYKKPRQRVRWTCDQCQALFLDRDRCQECGHRKCDECIRSPPRRIPRPPDPEIVEPVEDKLSIADEPSSSSRPIASSSS